MPVIHEYLYPHLVQERFFENWENKYEVAEKENEESENENLEIGINTLFYCCTIPIPFLNSSLLLLLFLFFF